MNTALAVGHLEELARARLEYGGGGKVADGAAFEAEQRVDGAELGGDVLGGDAGSVAGTEVKSDAGKFGYMVSARFVTGSRLGVI